MLTKADQLRADLDRLEAHLGKLGFGLGGQAMEIPSLMDAVLRQFQELEEGGFELPEEKLRWETVTSQARLKARLLLREIGGMTVLREARRSRQPDPSHWWWFLDEQVIQEQKASVKRMIRWAVAAVILVALLGVAYQLFLAPDPETQARVNYLYEAERFARDGNLQEAAQVVEKALGLAPGDPELLIFYGVLKQQLGDEATAESSFRQAQQTLKDEESFYLVRGQRYFYIGAYQQMLADAQAAIQVNPESAAGYMLQGQAQEALGQDSLALDSYEYASELAGAQNKPDIAVTARMLYGSLLQRQGMPTILPPTDEP